MARTATKEPRKTEHLGIPLDPGTKRRLKRVAKSKGRKHTDLARSYVIEGVDRDEPGVVGK